MHKPDPIREAHVLLDSLAFDAPALEDEIRDLNTLPVRISKLHAFITELRGERDTPETVDFLKGVALEADHQVARWGTTHDAGKAPEDWFWLLGYLAGKVLPHERSGDIEKAKHHTITSAAALLNWHRALGRGHSAMRPGIDPG